MKYIVIAAPSPMQTSVAQIVGQNNDENEAVVIAETWLEENGGQGVDDLEFAYVIPIVAGFRLVDDEGEVERL